MKLNTFEYTSCFFKKKLIQFQLIQLQFILKKIYFFISCPIGLGEKIGIHELEEYYIGLLAWKVRSRLSNFIVSTHENCPLVDCPHTIVS